MQIITLSEQEFENFAKNHKYRNYYQSIEYAEVMKNMGFETHFIGIKDSKLIGASLLIYKEVFMGKKIAYAPRGLLLDYSNKEKLIEITEKIKELLGNQGFILLRIDPYIPATIRDNKGKITNLNNEINNIMINIKSAGFKYKGQNKGFENEQPRYESIKLLNDTTINLYNNMNKRIKHKITRARGCGITISEDKTKNISELYNFIKDKKIFNKKYLNEIVKQFPTSQVYYAVLNTDSFVIESKKRYESELERNNNLAKKIQNIGKKNNKILNMKMESDRLIDVYKNDLVLATKLLKEYPKGLIISGLLTIDYNNSRYIIAEGYNKNFSHLNSNYLLKWYLIEKSKKQNLNYINMNALYGNFEKKNIYTNLNNAKLEYNSIPIEYIGEFDLILNNINYSMYQAFSKNKSYQFKRDLI